MLHHFVRCTFFMLHFFRVALIFCWTPSPVKRFPCCTFFHVAPFYLWYFFMLHLFCFASSCTHIMFHLFCVVPISSCKIFILQSFHVMLFCLVHFPFCTFFMLHYFWVALFCVAFIWCFTFSLLFCFHVPLFSCHTFLRIALFSCCNFCAFFDVALISC